MPNFFLNWCALFSQLVKKIDFAPFLAKTFYANNICKITKFFSQLVKTSFLPVLPNFKKIQNSAILHQS